MARYIDADRLISQFNRSTITKKQAILALIKLQPTADVVEVKHGKWEEHFSFGAWHYDCPFCGDGYATKGKDNTLPNYCGNCGAKMDGGEAE